MGAPAADGSSDDIDQPLRRLFADQQLVLSHGLMSLNSVNWSRILIQLAHFVYAYLELSEVERAEPGAALPELEVVVPTGGAGNIAGKILKCSVPFVFIAPRDIKLNVEQDNKLKIYFDLINFTLWSITMSFNQDHNRNTPLLNRL